MAFHSVIYELLKEKSPVTANAFLRDYKEFIAKRGLTLQKGTFSSVSAYFFAVFSADANRYQRELRCISGNRVCHLWLEDFKNVIADSYIRDHKTIAITTHGNSNLLISELGGLLGV